MRKACIHCGAIEPCPRHPKGNGQQYGHRSHNRDRAAQARFRRQIIQRDGYQCADCGTTEDLRACHLLPLSQGGGYDPAGGVLRCATCDQASDPWAR